jgi:hypothetical protein
MLRAGLGENSVWTLVSFEGLLLRLDAGDLTVSDSEEGIACCGSLGPGMVVEAGRRGSRPGMPLRASASRPEGASCGSPIRRVAVALERKRHLGRCRRGGIRC